MDDIPTELLVDDMVRKDLWLAVYKMAFQETKNDYAADVHANLAVEAYDKKFNDKGDGLV